MDSSKASRKYDVIVFGVTGFTGQFVAEELHRLVKTEGQTIKWAVAGRKESRIQAVLNGLKAIDNKPCLHMFNQVLCKLSTPSFRHPV